MASSMYRPEDVSGRGLKEAHGPKPPLDLSHHFSRVTKARKESSIKEFYKYFAIPGIGNLAGGLPNASFFPYDTLEASVALPGRFEPTPNKPNEIIGMTDKLATTSISRSSASSAHVVVPHASGTADPMSKIDLTTALQYGQAAGYPPLFSFIRQFTRENLHPNVPYLNGPDIQFTVGSTDGFAKTIEALSNIWSEGRDWINEREGILCEEFAYMNAIQTARPRGLQVVPVKMDLEGMLPMGKGGLEDVLANWDARTGRRPHLLYTVTIGQNPTSGTLSVQRRKEIYAICCKYDVIIIEDDPYWYLQFPSAAGRQASARNLPYKPSPMYTPTKGSKSSGFPFLDSLVPSFLSVDTEGRVVRLDTFSKTVAPGCRLGWVTSQPAIVERILRITETSTQQPSGFVQSMVAELIMGPQSKNDGGRGGSENGEGWKVDGWVRWLEGLRGMYERRMNRMCQVLEGGRFNLKQQRSKREEDSDWAVVTKIKLYDFDWPRGGMFVWIKMAYETHPLWGKVEAERLARALWIHLTIDPYLILACPGQIFSPTEEIAATEGWKYFRLCFAAVSEDDVDACSPRFVNGIQSFWKIKNEKDLDHIESLVRDDKTALHPTIRGPSSAPKDPLRTKGSTTLIKMEKITDKIAALLPNSNYFSLEFFPPKTAMGSSNLRARLDRMSRALRPLFVTVTWGAGGSTATKSLELAELCQRELGLTTCLHLTCTNMNRALVDRALEEAKVLGIRNILALRGDAPRSHEYREADETKESKPSEEGEFEWAIDLVRYIRKNYGDYFCVGVAAYPEGHADESHPSGQSLEHDLPYLVDKVQAGADFIMTQLYFDVEAYDKFEARLRSHPSGVFKDIPIIPGLMPIQSYQILKRTSKLSHAKIPEKVLKRIDDVRSDDEMVKKVGVDIISEIVETVKEIKGRTPGPRGFHFYTLNLEKAVTFVLERTNLIPASTPDIDESALLEMDESIKSLHVSNSIITNGISNQSRRSTRRQSSVGSDPHNRVIVDSASRCEFEASSAEAGIPKEPINTRANTLAISEGEGSLGREATWDDYPNGRWGDARSPAYGEIDGYGVSLHMSVNQAIKLWGYPSSISDITALFIRHLEGTLNALPWSEQGLNEETNTIKDQLLALNRRGWWTVASQPAVDGVRSSDAIFGWGPRNGFVFQKAFVELFLPSASWNTLRPLLLADESVSFLAINAAGTCETSDTSTVTGTNAVTWGVFPGKEIITPTIIEEVSFRAWGDEAFGIWGEWQRVYKPQSESAVVIGGIRDDYWLINVIHHAYVEGEGLWELLMSAPDGRSE